MRHAHLAFLYPPSSTQPGLQPTPPSTLHFALPFQPLPPLPPPQLEEDCSNVDQMPDLKFTVGPPHAQVTHITEVLN